MAFRLCTDNEPVVLIEVSGAMSDAELSDMCTRVTHELRTQQMRHARAAVVLDFTYADTIAPHQRKMIGQWRRDVRELTRHVCVGMAMVVRTPLVRGVLTAIGWFSPEPVPVVYLSTFEEAIDWAVSACTRAGIRVPPRVLRRVRAIGWMRDPAPSSIVSASLAATEGDFPKRQQARTNR